MKKEKIVELRRHQWTTKANLDIWFTAWRKFLLEQGFAHTVPPPDTVLEGEVFISDDQKQRFINMDETGISLDGSQGRSGGRPSGVIVAVGVTRIGTAVNKAGVSDTLM